MNRQIAWVLLASLSLMACRTSKSSGTRVAETSFQASIDLTKVEDDKVAVRVTPPAISSSSVQYQFAKIIPGTYSIADYGRYIENFQAFDKEGRALRIAKDDVNTYTIQEANKLASISYQVNDTYDNEGDDVFSENSTTIFSPAGTNIFAGKNFMLNMSGFIGYFSNMKDIPYRIQINHPEFLQASTSLTDEDGSGKSDLFVVPRFAEVVDHPIMYASPDIASTKIDNMELILSMYSPRNKNISASAFLPDIEKMMRAQKKYLGKINNTPKYAILVYITSGAKDDARGLGALEHNTSTTATFNESMKSKDLIHVISHEFFHTLTPLNVHSKEIHDFDFNQPKMSAHLWMYEGFTEYFANHFQVHEGLIYEEKFYALMSQKLKNSKQYFRDNLSFTEMSKNVLNPTMKAQYPNVYEKGALMAMCLDILLRESSGGKSGILNVMANLSKKYGPNKPFDDDSFIQTFTEMTNPQVGAFLQEHVVKGTPINYDQYLNKVGLQITDVPEPTLVVFLANGKPYLTVDTVQKKAIASIKDNNNLFMNAMGVQDGDEIIEMDGVPVDASNPNNVLMLGYGLEENQPYSMKVKRNGTVKELKGQAKLNYGPGKGLKFVDQTKFDLKEAWLKN
jgi:predicted metalloprotease with PDZ domain